MQWDRTKARGLRWRSVWLGPRAPRRTVDTGHTLRNRLRDSLWAERYLVAMARLARVVAPSVPRHITQPGNRRQQTFFCDEDYVSYLGLLREWFPRRGVGLWAYS